jgi:hypothetical protein
MKLRIVFLLVLLFFSGIIFPTPEDTSDPDHPFAKHLASLYADYLDAARQGDVSSAMGRTTAEYQDAFSNITPELLKSMCGAELDPRESHFIKVDAGRNTARVIFTKDADDMIIWQAVIFKLESGRWKIAGIAKYGRDKDSGEDTLALLLKDTSPFHKDDD